MQSIQRSINAARCWQSRVDRRSILNRTSHGPENLESTLWECVERSNPG